jgi:hypothetical protein
LIFFSGKWVKNCVKNYVGGSFCATNFRTSSININSCNSNQKHFKSSPNIHKGMSTYYVTRFFDFSDPLPSTFQTPLRSSNAKPYNSLYY